MLEIGEMRERLASDGSTCLAAYGGYVSTEIRLELRAHTTPKSCNALQRAGSAVGPMTDVDASFVADRTARAAGTELLAAGPGSAHTALTIRPDQVNGLGGVHGSVVIFLLADTAFGVACNSPGRPTVARS